MADHLMNEPFWLSCDDPRPMLEHLRDQASARKLRWFACACVRAVWHLLRDPRSRAAVEAAERFADGGADPIELARADRAAFEVAEAADLRATVSDPFWAAARAAARAVSFDPYGAASGAAFISALCAAPWSFDPTGAVVHSGDRTAKAQVRRRQAELLREIIGNPYRAVSLPPRWLSWNENIVAKLAMFIYRERCFDELPILGDALEEAGCTDEAVLAHCRQGGGHTRGCWVVDLVLGKS